MKAETAWTSKRFKNLRHAKAQHEAQTPIHQEPSSLAAHAGQEPQKPRDISHLFLDNHAADNAQQPGSWSDALPSLGGCHVL
ncbi:hypothetical protein Psal001_02152 [Piscirickettsia salmonis]|nr:hypothetical protein [Piscirickettsia salmonis]QGN77932.1 hypothetical protein Psal001_02152 [Piscirickettsia salmonis]